MKKSAVITLLVLALFISFACRKNTNPAAPAVSTFTATPMVSFTVTMTLAVNTATCTQTLTADDTITVTPSAMDTSTPTATATLTPRTPPADGIYRMRIKHSNYYVDLEGGGLSEGTNIYQWEPNGTNNQRWLIEQVSPPYYRIQSFVSGNAADVAGVSYDNGANIHSWHWTGTDNQLWLLVDTYDGGWNVQSKLSGKNWDVQGAETYSGANIYQWDAHAGDNQRFFLEASENTPTFTATSTPLPASTATMTATQVCAVSVGTSAADSWWYLYNGYIFASAYTLASDTVITALGMSQNNPDLYVIGVYTDNAGKPGSLITQTGIHYYADVTKEWPITPVTLYSGNTYWLVTTTENGQHYRAAGNNSLHAAYSWNTVVADNGLPADLSSITWTSTAVVNTIYAISCN